MYETFACALERYRMNYMSYTVTNNRRVVADNSVNSIVAPIHKTEVVLGYTYCNLLTDLGNI